MATLARIRARLPDLDRGRLLGLFLGRLSRRLGGHRRFVLGLDPDDVR